MTQNKQTVRIKGKEIQLAGAWENETGVGNRSAEAAINELLLALDETEPEWSADKLKTDDRYWYIDSAGCIENTFWDKRDNSDIYRLKTNNIYKDRESALEAYKRIMDK